MNASTLAVSLKSTGLGVALNGRLSLARMLSAEQDFSHMFGAQPNIVAGRLSVQFNDTSRLKGPLADEHLYFATSL
jgi:hypothetical protein